MKRFYSVCFVLVLLISALLPSGDSLADESVCIDEIGMTLTVPTGFAWATRSKGDHAALTSLYKLQAGKLPEYMESLDNFFMAMEVKGDCRFSVTSVKAAIDIKDYSDYSEKELLEIANDPDTLSMADSVYDTWVGGTKEHPFACVAFSYTVSGITSCFVISLTCYEGWFYTITARGSSIRDLMRLTDSVLPTVSIKRNARAKEEKLYLDSVDISFICPEGWYWNEESHQTQKDPKTGVTTEGFFIMNIDYSSFSINSIGITVTNIGAGQPKSLRDMVDKTYGTYLSIADLKANGIDATESRPYSVQGIPFTLFKDTLDDGSGLLSLMGAKNGCIILFQFTSLEKDPEEDKNFPFFEQWLNSVSFFA